MDLSTRIRRSLYGLFAAVGVLVLVDLLPPMVPFSQHRLLDYFYLWPGPGNALMMGVAAFVGSYVAKVRFVLPSICLTVIWWSIAIWLLNSIAAVAGQGDLRNVAATNALGLVFGVAGSVMGSLLGERLTSRRAG